MIQLVIKRFHLWRIFCIGDCFPGGLRDYGYGWNGQRKKHPNTMSFWVFSFRVSPRWTNKQPARRILERPFFVRPICRHTSCISKTVNRERKWTCVCVSVIGACCNLHLALNPECQNVFSSPATSSFQKLLDGIVPSLSTQLPAGVADMIFALSHESFADFGRGLLRFPQWFPYFSYMVMTPQRDTAP